MKILGKGKEGMDNEENSMKVEVNSYMEIIPLPAPGQ